MKSIYLLALGCLLASEAALAAQPVFSVGFTAEDGFTQEDFDRWTFVDANEDEKTWVYSADAIPTRVYYSYHATNAGDDWLISPQITIPESGTYVVRYVCTGSSYSEALEVWYGSEPTVASMNVKGCEDLNLLGNPTPGYFIASFEAGETVYLGFHAVSQPNKWRLYLNAVEVVAVENPVDLGVSEIISPQTGENLSAETVKVRVSNYGITAATGFDVCYSVNGGNPVVEHCQATLEAGQSMEYTFAAPVDCSQSNGKYEIKAYTSHPGDVAPYNDATSAVVRHIGAATIPYRNGFEPDDNTDNFTYLNLNNDDGTWSVGVNSFWTLFSRTGNGYLAYNYNRTNSGDDWVFIDPLEVEAGDYVLRFWYSATENHTERLRVCWGNEARPEAMTNTICEIDPMNNEEYKESISLFSIPSSQKVFVGFYAYSDADENWLLIDDLSIEKADASLLDIQVSAISEPGSYIRSNNRRDVVANVRNISIEDKTVAVSLYVDEILIETKQEVVRLMEVRDITFANALADLSDGTHSVKVEAAYDGDTDLSNNTAVLDVMVVEKAPVAIWDFEDEEFPAGFTFRSEDSASVNPGGTDLFGDNGLAIMGVQNHYLYGSNVFAICTWFDDASVTADRWLVLPQMHIDGENSHLVWDCSSMSAQDYDDYDICVSTGNDVWYEYTAVMSVKGENEFAKTRGVSLAPYSGKDVYVAFHVKTVDGMALILDNIGLYGELSTAGVEGVVSASPEASLRYVGGSIVCGVDAEISVFALDGSLAARGNGVSLDVAHLAPGVYVARATGAAAGATLKFVVK